MNTYGPEFRWFAWHPTFTRDRGWRWLRLVRRRRCFIDVTDMPAMAGFETAIDEFC